jgi:outer membrane receptor protein involved in Fe transport
MINLGNLFFRKCTLFITAFIFCQVVIAQKAGNISGYIVNKNLPLEYVNVSLFKLPDTTKAANFTSTDSLGRFLFDRVEPGEYQIKFSLIGYKSSSEVLRLSEQSGDIKFENYSLNTDPTLLKFVTVTSQKKLIEKTTEGFIVNASANITQLGGTATDLLKNTPTVAVDADGAITLRGKTPLILINGRNSGISNTDQIAASSIESIEIINNPTAKYDANAESGIINIKLKKNTQNGTNGAVAIGTGFGSRGRINSSILINHKIKKWNLGLGYDNRFAGRTRKIEASRTNFYLPDTYLLNQNRNDERLEQLQNIKLNIDFSPNTKNTISFEAIGNKEGQDNYEMLHSILYKQNKTFNSNARRHAIELARSKVAEFALVYSRKFIVEGKLLSASFTSSFDNDRENTNINSQSLNENFDNIGTPDLQRTHNYERGNVSNARLDYAFPVSGKGLLETGYKGIFRCLNADFETSDFLNNTYVVNTGASNVFWFNEQVHAVYALYNSFSGDRANPKWKYSVGIRTEQVLNNGETQSSGTNFKNQYVKFFPNATVSYYTNPDEFWKLSYGKRINRPGLGQLNPFTDITDALNPHGGNPKLKPEIIHALELGYHKEWEKYSFSSSLFYRYSLDAIRQYAQLQPNGANLTLPTNIGNALTYGIENIFSVRAGKFYDVNGSLSFFQQQINGANLAKDAVQNAFGWYGKLINNFAPWQGGKIQVIGNYNSALATPQGKRIALYNVDIGFQQRLGKGNTRLGLIVTDLFNTLKSGYKNYTSQFSNYRNSKADTRAVMISLAYSFKSAFKEKLLENKFSAEY